MKPQAKKLLQEVVESWKDFDISMKIMAGGNFMTTEEQHYARLAKASERWQAAIRAAEAYLEKKN